MEQMPFRPEFDQMPELDRSIDSTWSEPVVTSDWRTGLPTLTGRAVVLRELRLSDAASLCALLTAPEVARFISPPPTTIEGFERFIVWAARQRQAGAYICYAVTLEGFDTAIGLFQLRTMGADFSTAEWGFAIGSAFWGTGLFAEAARVVLDFAFDTLGVQRLEARAAIRNGRGNGALLKLGAVQEAVLRRSFSRGGEWLDQALYSLLVDEWRARRAPASVDSIGFRVLIH